MQGRPAARLPRQIAWAAAVAAATLLVQIPVFDRWTSMMDDGHMLQFADLVAGGGELYRDATVYPLPGSFYLLALVFWVFEPSILVSRWVVVIEFALFAALVHLWLRRMMAPGFALLGVVLLWLYRAWSFPHWQFYSYSTTSMLLFVASLVALLSALERADRRRLVLAGLLFGTGVACKQDYGAAALLVSGVTLAAHARAPGSARRGGFLADAAWFLAPAAVVGLAVGLYFFQRGLLGDLLRFTVLNHFAGMAAYEYDAFPDLLPLFAQDPALRAKDALYKYWPGLLITADLAAAQHAWLYARTWLPDLLLKLFYYGPYPFLVLAALRLWRRRREAGRPETRARHLAEVALFSLAAAQILLITVNRPQDYVHLAVLYWPLACLGLLALHDRSRGRLRAAPALVAIAAIALVAGYTVHLVQRLRVLYHEPVPLARAGVRMQPLQAKLLAELVAYVHAHVAPDQTLAAMPYYPLLNFLAERRGPHRAGYIVWPFAELPRRDEEVVEAMERLETPLVVYHYSSLFPSFPPFESYAAGIHDYLVDRYEIDRVFSSDMWDHRIAALLRVSGETEGRLLPPEQGTIRIGRRGRWQRERSLAESDGRFERSSWPFVPALVLEPAAGEATAWATQIDVGPGERLRTAIGVHPDDWARLLSSPATFRVEVEDGGRRAALWQRTLEPSRSPEDRGWFPVEVPLAPWVDRRVTLVLSVESLRPDAGPPGRCSWAVPVLAGAPARAATGAVKDSPP